MVARSSSVNGVGDTINVAIRSRVTSTTCSRGLAMPKSRSDATPSDSNLVVSEAASGSNQRDTLNTPVGVRALRKTRHPSRV